MDDKKPIRQSRVPGQIFDLYGAEDEVPEVYVDGFIGTYLSPSVAKINFFIAVGSDEDEQGVPIEKRVLKLRLVLPTSAWIETCAKTLTSIAEQKGTLLTSFDQNKESVLKYLDAVELEETGTS